MMQGQAFSTRSQKSIQWLKPGFQRLSFLINRNVSSFCTRVSQNWCVLWRQTGRSLGLHCCSRGSWYRASQEKTRPYFRRCNSGWKRNASFGVQPTSQNIFIPQYHTTTQVARAVISHGGSVKGWAPKILLQQPHFLGEVIGELEVTETMSERLAKMFEASEA